MQTPSMLIGAALTLALLLSSGGLNYANAASKERTWKYDMRLIPLKGPIFDEAPKLVIKGKSTTNKRQSEGSFSFSLPDGADCEGEWVAANDQGSPTTRARGLHPHVEGIDEGNGTMTIQHERQNADGEGSCTNGAVFILLLVNQIPIISDSRGNVFRMRR